MDNETRITLYSLNDSNDEHWFIRQLLSSKSKSVIIDFLIDDTFKPDNINNLIAQNIAITLRMIRLYGGDVTVNILTDSFSIVHLAWMAQCSRPVLCLSPDRIAFTNPQMQQESVSTQIEMNYLSDQSERHCYFVDVINVIRDSDNLTALDLLKCNFFVF